MKFCKYCGKEVKDETVICPSCGCQVKEFDDDSVNPGFVILSIIIPIVGIIMAIAFWKKTPKAARAYLRAALITTGKSILPFATATAETEKRAAAQEKPKKTQKTQWIFWKPKKTQENPKNPMVKVI